MKQLKRDIERILEDATAKGENACAAVMLWHDYEETLFELHGLADIQQQKPVTRDSIYRLYSLSKPMTAVTAMTLIERGQLDLLAPVSDFLEGFKDQRVALSDTETEPVKRPVQVRDLFTMTSGLPYPGEEEPAERAMTTLYGQLKQEMMDQSPLSTIAAANRIGQSPLAHQPGEAWKYGTSADVLGAVIEVVSGKPINEYMTDVLFGPLHMTDTDFFVPAEKRDRLVTVYERTETGLKTHPESESLHGVFSLPSVLEGGAGIYSTIDDVMHFGRMLLGGGKLKRARILSKNSVSWLSENHLTPQQQSYLMWDSVLGCGYGGLMRVLLSPGQSFSLGAKGEFGWDGWTGTYMSVSPDTKSILVVMQQIAGAGTNAVIRRIRNAVYANI